jgi:hypothetical protein
MKTDSLVESDNISAFKIETLDDKKLPVGTRILIRGVKK